MVLDRATLARASIGTCADLDLLMRDDPELFEQLVSEVGKYSPVCTSHRQHLPIEKGLLCCRCGALPNQSERLRLENSFQPCGWAALHLCK